MADCPTCEYHKQRAQIWRDEAYKLSGHPLPEREQEPVVWNLKDVTDAYKLGAKSQQRTWVGLTDEDDIDWEEGGNLKDLVKAIESKLEEKNT